MNDGAHDPDQDQDQDQDQEKRGRSLKERKLTLSNLDPMVRIAVEAARDKKAENILVLDLHGLASFTDYFLICSGTSNRQLKTIADEVEEKLRVSKRKPSHVEGYPKGEWILMDYVDFVVHIFTAPSRAHYDLERLWGDGRRLTVGSETRSPLVVKSKVQL
jgi:ribosome-associated protein